MDTAAVEITKVCPFCGKVNRVIVDTESYRMLQDGVPIQRVFPTASATQREILISGICENCQNDIFGGDNDE